ncbi:amidinotransferase [Streptomyces sp. NPDC004111]|uniref:amidinotransferase n=1 Tax=Streptomyces sp. NPDC004111 TaxID=3364690 RepID=UPI0036ADB0CB
MSGRTEEELPVVNSYTEWDPLEEVVVGSLDGGVFPTWQESMGPTLPHDSVRLFKERGGTPLPAEHAAAAEEELNAFAAVLQQRGITVVRPEPADHTRTFGAPEWQSGGNSSGMPRDLLIVVGDTIVETPMSWRCRKHEVDAFRGLIKSYFRRGGGWLAAPQPELRDPLFDGDFDAQTQTGWAISDYEPVFDAADFMRFGDDLVVQRSHVTNEFGIAWMRRALGSRFRVHEVPVNDPHAMHIDATMVPLAPGKLLVNPDRYVPHPLFADWEILEAPKPALGPDWPMYFCSPWLSMNVLSLDERTVVVERQEQPLLDALTDWGFTCVPVDFRHVYSFGGSFHCATLDVRRRGRGGTYLNGTI